MERLDHLRQLMREIGPLMQLGSVVELNDRPAWQIEIDEAVGVEAVYDPDAETLALIAVAGMPPQLPAGTVCERLLAYNADWPGNGRPRAGLRGVLLSLAEDSPVLGLSAAGLAGMLGELDSAMRALIADLERDTAATAIPGDAGLATRV